MKDEALALYIRDVLGTEIPRPEPVIDVAPILVVSEELTEFSRDLLHKILGSVGLAHWRHQTLTQNPIRASHRLVFSGGATGRNVVGEEVHWILPRLQDMLGEGADVTANKRAAWGLLQIFKQEVQF